MIIIKTVYVNLIKCFFVVAFFSLILLGLVFWVSDYLFKIDKPLFETRSVLSKEKQISYECGFTAFNDTRDAFDVQFHITAIMFLLFDVELVFLLPWIINLGEIGLNGLLSGLLFFLLLLIGFYYELKRGALNWPKKNIGYKKK